MEKPENFEHKVHLDGGMGFADATLLNESDTGLKNSVRQSLSIFIDSWLTDNFLHPCPMDEAVKSQRAFDELAANHLESKGDIAEVFYHVALCQREELEDRALGLPSLINTTTAHSTLRGPERFAEIEKQINDRIAHRPVAIRAFISAPLPSPAQAEERARVVFFRQKLRALIALTEYFRGIYVAQTPEAFRKPQCLNSFYGAPTSTPNADSPAQSPAAKDSAPITVKLSTLDGLLLGYTEEQLTGLLVRIGMLEDATSKAYAAIAKAGTWRAVVEALRKRGHLRTPVRDAKAEATTLQKAWEAAYGSGLQIRTLQNPMNEANASVMKVFEMTCGLLPGWPLGKG